MQLILNHGHPPCQPLVESPASVPLIRFGQCPHRSRPRYKPRQTDLGNQSDDKREVEWTLLTELADFILDNHL